MINDPLQGERLGPLWGKGLGPLWGKGLRPVCPVRLVNRPKKSMATWLKEYGMDSRSCCDGCRGGGGCADKRGSLVLRREQAEPVHKIGVLRCSYRANSRGHCAK